MELDNAIDELNKVEANIKLLKEKWETIKSLLNYPAEGNWHQGGKKQYEIECLEFNNLLDEIPKIRDVELKNILPDYDEVSQWARDVHDLGEADAFTSFISEIYKQGSEIDKYEHLLKLERRKLIRNQVSRYIGDIDQILNPLNVDLEENNLRNPIDPEILIPLRDKILKIDILMGNSVPKPSRWSDIERHLNWVKLMTLMI